MTIREIVSIYDYLLSLPMDYKHSHPIYELLTSLEDELRIKVNEVKEIVVDDFALLIKKIGYLILMMKNLLGVSICYI